MGAERAAVKGSATHSKHTASSHEPASSTQEALARRLGNENLQRLMRARLDERAARYRGRVTANRIRKHGKVSADALARIEKELAYFAGAARKAYIREVRPAYFGAGELLFPGEGVPDLHGSSQSLLASDPRGLSGGLDDSQIYAGQDESARREKEELAHAQEAEIAKLKHLMADWLRPDAEFALDLLRPLIQLRTNIDPRAVSARIMQPIVDRYRTWLELEDSARLRRCIRMGGLVGKLVEAQMKFHPEMDNCASWFADKEYGHGISQLRHLERLIRINLGGSRGTESPAEIIYWDMQEYRKLTDPRMLMSQTIASGLIGKATQYAQVMGDVPGIRARPGAAAATPEGTSAAPAAAAAEGTTSAAAAEGTTSAAPAASAESTTSTAPAAEHAESKPATPESTNAVPTEVTGEDTTQPYPKIEELGDYTFASQQSTQGDTLRLRIWNWARKGGPKQDKADFGPLRFAQQLIERARGTGSKTLELTIENITARSVQGIDRPQSNLWRRFGAKSVERIDDRTIRVVIPLEEAAASNASGARGVPAANSGFEHEEPTQDHPFADIPTLTGQPAPGARASGASGKTRTFYRFADITNPQTLTSRAGHSEQSAAAAAAIPLHEMPLRAEAHARLGLVENSPLVSVGENIDAMAQSTDPWLQTIVTGRPGLRGVERAPFIVIFEIPESRLYRATNSLSTAETEWLFFGEDLIDFMVGAMPNPFK